ncbi:MAG: formylglycine-generating enzyme family protein [Gammaproteobacteria bacterium]|nr:formylglycine-generating enzyme family protein [Gammaproteobacteria bacterium]
MRVLNKSRLSLLLLLFAVTPILSAAEFTNFMGMKLVDIPAGNFQMGSCKMTEGMRKENRKRVFLGLPTVDPGCGAFDKTANENETPRHKVSVSTFKMATTPVTAGQYVRYLKAIGEVDSKDDWGLYTEEFQRLNSFGDNAPVVQVSWHEAQDFIRWMNKNKPANDPLVYRMPSEAEWEYACRAGKKQTYCGSDNVFDVGWVNRKESEHQHDVATKAANAWGLYDMSGSIWQWVEDVYHDNYVGAPLDGSAWNSLSPDEDVVLQQDIAQVETLAKKGKLSKTEAALTVERLRYDAGAKYRRGVPIKSETVAARVLRGGSWRFAADFSRSTYRLAGEPGNWYYGNGFRIAASKP